MGWRTATMRSPATRARMTAREKTQLILLGSAAPWASAVSPVVPMRRNPNTQKTTLSIMPPAAMAAMYASEPRWPVTAVSHSPSRGTVMLLAMAGRASAKILRLMVDRLFMPQNYTKKPCGGQFRTALLMLSG